MQDRKSDKDDSIHGLDVVTHVLCDDGAYPESQHYDMCDGKPNERPDADENIVRVFLPRSFQAPATPLADAAFAGEGPACSTG